MKRFLFEYPFQGRRYSFDIPADSAEEATARLKALGWAKYQGELIATIPVPGASLLVRLWCWIMGRAG